MSNRPVFLNLTQIRFPVTAIVSILHRVSGVALFFAMPIILYWLCLVTYSEASFAHMLVLNQIWWIKTLFFLVLVAIIYHMVAGTRHLYHDFGHNHGLQASRCSAWATMLISVVLVLLSAWRLFG